MELDPAQFLVRTADSRLRFSWYVWRADAGCDHRLRVVIRQAVLSPTRAFSHRSNPVVAELAGRWIKRNGTICASLRSPEPTGLRFSIRGRCGRVRFQDVRATFDYRDSGPSRIAVSDSAAEESLILNSRPQATVDCLLVELPGLAEPIECPLAWVGGQKCDSQWFSEASTRTAGNLGVQQHLSLAAGSVLLCTLIPQLAEAVDWSQADSG